MTEQEKEFVKELVEDTINAACDLGSGFEEAELILEKEPTLQDLDRSGKKVDLLLQNLTIASEKLYNWIDKQ